MLNWVRKKKKKRKKRTKPAWRILHCNNIGCFSSFLF